MELICLLSKDEGSWAQVSGLMTHSDWEKIVLVGGDEAKSFSHAKKFEFVKVDLSKKLINLKEDLLNKLKGKFSGMEVACSIASGDGKEHMALVSGLINVPVGIRFCALTKEGVVWL
jgi:hypothetical protein